ncbi:MAG: NmrA-like family protein, partial [Bacteroidetes bacterium HGW-Bacteroidetes-15]
MKRILITGATGNVGIEVIKYLFKEQSSNQIVAGVRDIDKARLLFGNYPSLEYTQFDFENNNTYTRALSNIDTIFLLRPPHISDVEKFFKPLISKIKESEVKEIVFLSVQGAEKSSIIPHNMIEKLIKEAKIDYIFLRPS